MQISVHKAFFQNEPFIAFQDTNSALPSPDRTAGTLNPTLCWYWSSCLYTKHYTDQVFSSVLIFTFLLRNWCTHTGYSMADSKIGGGIISDEPGASFNDSKSECSQEYLKTTQNNLQNKQSIKQTKTNLGICDTDTGTSIEYSWNNGQ